CARRPSSSSRRARGCPSPWCTGAATSWETSTCPGHDRSSATPPRTCSGREADVRVTVLAGGVGGARFVRGVRAAMPDADVTVVVNTGDDLWLTGVRLQPDLDSILYALAGVNDTERGWGRADETERVSAELREWGAGWPWFTLGDLDLGTHLARTGWLREGLTPTQIAERLAARWPIGVRLLPMTDAEVDTQVVLADGRRLHL